MQTFRLFEFLPLGVTFACVVAGVLLSIWVGTLFGGRRRSSSLPDGDDGPVGIIVSATLGLLAFILGFTFGLTANRFDARRQLQLDEVTAIETTVLRSALIPEPHRTEVQEMMRRYIELRIAAPSDPASIENGIAQSEELQRQLWPHAAAMADADLKNPDVVSLFVDSMNDLVNAQTRRITITKFHIPWLIWLVLFGLMIVSMVEVGYLFGRRNVPEKVFLIALSVCFSGVMILIIDLDRTGTGTIGTISVSNQPMMDLHKKLYHSRPPR